MINGDYCIIEPKITVRCPDIVYRQGRQSLHEATKVIAEIADRSGNQRRRTRRPLKGVLCEQLP